MKTQIIYGYIQVIALFPGGTVFVPEEEKN